MLVLQSWKIVRECPALEQLADAESRGITCKELNSSRGLTLTVADQPWEFHPLPW
jgi:hypothetical protein